MRLLREGYHERLFLLTDEREGMIVRKQAKEASSTLLAEIAWLEELPPSLHDYFPRVLRSCRENGNGQALFYDMPYFGHGWVLLSELVLTQALDRALALTLIAQVMQIMFGGIFPTTYAEEESGYPERLVLLLEHWAQRISQTPAFSSLMRSEAVILGGAKLWNVFPLLELLKDDKRIREKLRPAAIRKVHGDLHPENILIYVPSLRRPTPRVMLLDPIAAIGLSRGDFAMDAAKFRSWLSAELLALRLGLFSVRKEQGSIPTFELTLHTGDAQLCALSDGALLHE
ncbi:MAG: phosphotransferase, partial [Deltaproteobacteria bacterium]|nr:phosphotransferase [Deltaproteobacteria bacterium]